MATIINKEAIIGNIHDNIKEDDMVVESLRKNVTLVRDESAMESKQGINVAVFEGGGIKGICELVILTKIEEITGKPICKLFDCLAGTSVGGLIAILLSLPDPENKGMPLYSAQQALTIFKEIAQDIFPQGITMQKLLSCDGFWYNKFSPKPLEKALEKYCHNNTLKDLVGDVFITAYDQSNLTKHALSFSTIEAKHNEHSDYYLKDIARGATAAPTYFPSKEITNTLGTKTHIVRDGGVYANDPILEAYKLLEDNGYHIKDALYLSLKEEDTQKYENVCCGGGILELLCNSFINKILDTTQQSDENLANIILKDHLIELATPIPKSNAEMSNAHPKNIEALQKLAHEAISTDLEHINYNENFHRSIDRIIKNYNDKYPNDRIDMNKDSQKEVYFKQFGQYYDEDNSSMAGAINHALLNKDIVSNKDANRNDSDDIASKAIITNDNREQILDSIKQYFTSFANDNPELKESMNQSLAALNDYSNQELEKLILDFAAGKKVVQEMNPNEAGNVLAPYMSCSMEANQEAMKLEGIDDEVQSHEIYAY